MATDTATASILDIHDGISGENLEYVALYLSKDDDDDWLGDEGGSWHITGICSTEEACATLNRHDEEQGYETRTDLVRNCWDLIDSLDGFRYAVMCRFANREENDDPWMVCAAVFLREDAEAIVDAWQDDQDNEFVIVTIGA